MSISSALYSGISGLDTLGNSMAVIGDNIANVNTMAFKGSRATFQDLLAQNVSVASGTAQIGRGVRMATVSADFTQGAFENTNSPTDLAIGGNGFFIVSNRDTADRYYTRAGQFTFDRDGYLVNPQGLVVQGWQLDPTTGQDVGDITNILLGNFSSAPAATSLVQMSTNLDSSVPLETVNSDLQNNWDATNDPPIGSTLYDYQTSMNIYDSLGSQHTITYYFDRTTTANQYEFLVTSDPAGDGDAAAKGAAAGTYMHGVITFDNNGNISGYSNLELKDPTDATTWTAFNPATDVGTNGYPQFRANFNQPQLVELNMGLFYNAGVWSPDPSYRGTQYATSATTTSTSQDGYGPGTLQNVSVDTSGVMTGHYSNGQITPLYRVALANFNNPLDLTKKGGNLYQQTQLTGDPSTGHPGTNGLGSIASDSLEESNVDLANQFVKMIITQRGFQANSRIITTTDTMLEELINLKR